MMAVRTTVHLDEELLRRVRQIVPERGLNRFINEALEEKTRSVERLRIEEAMREGYIATRRDRTELNEEWSAVETESWPE
jgi:metal-responsive CopG/Arc/MetJ family transcriptional regulator